MIDMENSKVLNKPETVIEPDALFHHWQGHRDLTRRTIEVFPEKELFEFSIGGMRPFAELAMEMIIMAGPTIKGLATGEWKKWEESESEQPVPKTKQDLLSLWDKTTELLSEYWPKI